MQQPTETTAAGFAKLVMGALTLKGHGSLREFSAVARISPVVMSEISQGRFPGQPKNEHSRERFERGRIQSVTKICDALELDLESCLTACALPAIDREIARARGELGGKWPSLATFKLARDDLEALLQIVDVVGPVAYEMVPELVFGNRANRETRTS